MDEELVVSGAACPACGENRMDNLAMDDGVVTCCTCGKVYDLEPERDQTQSYYDRAQERIRNAPELAEHRDLLLDYDWPNTDEHLAWVASAPVAEILDWLNNLDNEEGAAL